jgi:DnaK suppressor protein
MNTAPDNIGQLQEMLERKQAELVGALRKRDHIAIEKSADQMDQIQYASERYLAIRDVDRDSTLLREVKAALRRIRDGSFGVCVDCEQAISPKRLLAVPWASRCVQCQDIADRDAQERMDSITETLIDAA